MDFDSREKDGREKVRAAEERRRRDHQVRSAEPTSRGPCEEGLPAPPAAVRAGGADATQGSERGDTGGNGAISNLLFVCLC